MYDCIHTLSVVYEDWTQASLLLDAFWMLQLYLLAGLKEPHSSLFYRTELKELKGETFRPH